MKYVYQYTAESRNGVVGTAHLRNGPKVSCQVRDRICVPLYVINRSYQSSFIESAVTYLQVEIEVPQRCRFIVHTRDCALSEVSVMDPQGQPMYKQAPGSDAFQAAMAKLVQHYLTHMQKIRLSIYETVYQL